ncbi:hypothetical protein J14TS2_05400 [Bacillus sp. J14TS2]|uniref:hypothetical protein n=1 Tax=Bacillus sp. J14TS2 TaxID=2807188 RepID=UPI001B143F58|nr:hypothetical protein [Bacillus sp. J14TS2]GIN70065.1 hypothetical protein J14TS2_05400 [Bacillus sp. J14TS2]
MHYLMEDVTLLFADQLKKVSVLVQKNEIRYIGYSAPKFNVMKVNVQAFLLTPSFVFYSPNIPSFSFEAFKTYFSQEYLLKGCGCILTDFAIQYQHQFLEKLEKKRLELLNSPIDYVLGVKLKANKLTPKIVQLCNRETIPVLFIELENSQELEEIPWGWIRETSYPNKPLFIPDVSNVVKPLQQRHLLKKWHEFLQYEKINHLPTPPPSNKPLNPDILKKIGLYPKKGVLKAGGEISYNLVLKQAKRGNLSSWNDRSIVPHISVHNGKFVILNQSPIFRPGFGKEMKIQQTGLFI